MLLALFPLLAGPVASSAPGEPFPLVTTTVKTDDGQFFVQGRQELPRNAKVALLRRAKVEGSAVAGPDGAQEDATIEVSGTLEIKAVTGGKVELRNVWIELTPDCRSLYLSDVRFIGGGGIRPAKGGGSNAEVYMEKVEFLEGASLSLECTDGTVTVSSVHSKAPVSLLGVPRSERADSNASLRVIGCKGGQPGAWRGMMGGLTLSGAKSALVQFSYLEGGLSRFADNGKLSFEGNNVRSGSVEFAYSTTGQFKKATVSGCDFGAKEIAFLAPLDGGKTERVTIKDCWFSSGTEPEAILAGQVYDSTRNAESSAQVSLKKVKDAPVGLGGKAGQE
ncbi:hypothetical protein Poly30_47880 [Planctomycetes bacterium Poly30]|uniref:Right handed beta helix domain-containing protein n=1 Tax=Saltatorellus ferox TaxID=2528018 RepID=A0A518EYR7_9BACT|nr:hypothetical protein Poly30_47880 [Planctomycetes bacterium Poly30]